jgi:hypothetical protein
MGLRAFLGSFEDDLLDAAGRRMRRRRRRMRMRRRRMRRRRRRRMMGVWGRERERLKSAHLCQWGHEGRDMPT